ncbi:uncharacterized protein EAF02_001364 [Botrytis sinoallii]|uniref:uncharacterized protein n=1 Tax=Botrytis sinoallii TaxID=1463999 RepID=UPI001901794A|nr:uncharacterized protein EAF02_001364 [Botrytis sinoallii]KAF7891039.1 hypothetical protein EAF02_001364 [Botrytis sinoallii]
MNLPFFGIGGTPYSGSESDEQIPVDLISIDEIQRAAQRDYPNESSEIALAKYTIGNLIRDIEFEKSGSRFVFDPNIRLYYDKQQRRGELVTFFFNSEYRKAPRLNEVDRTSNLLLRCRQSLCLDPGDSWNLPISHPRHILKFPKEIISRILNFILVLEEEQGSLVPDAITCNLNSQFLYRKPDYSVHYSEYIGPICQTDPWLYSQYSIRFRRKTHSFCKLETGSQTLLKMNHLVDDRFIDASCLRVFGSACMVDESNPRKRNQYAKFRTPDPSLLSLSDWNNEIGKGISQIKDPSSVDRMSWLYYDPFLRFLHSIGLKNAAFLKTLQFTGIARTYTSHLPRDHIAALPSDDIRPILQLYVKFINQLCPGIQQITLNIHPEERGDGNLEKDLSLLLGDHIRELKTVKTLILRTADSSQSEKYVSMKFPLATETMQWFTDRTARRVAEDRKLAGFML